MLDMGFVEDIETLLDATPDTRQAVLFSATIPRRIETLAQKYLREPVAVRIARGGARGRGAAGAADRVPRAARAHHRRAGSGAGGGAARRRDRVLPHAAGRRRASPRPSRPRPARRGAARRHGPGAPHPRGRPAAQRAHRAAGRHRRRGPRAGHRPAHARGQPRRAAVARGVRAPHRARRAGRARRRRDHARAAVEDVRRCATWRSSPGSRSRSRPCRRPPTCAPPGSSAPGSRWRSRRGGLDDSATSRTCGPCSPGSPPSTTCSTSPPRPCGCMQSAAGAPDDGEDIPVVSAGRTRGERSERPVKGRGADRAAEVGHDPALRQRRARGWRAAAGHRGRARQRVEPLWSRHRRDPDPRAARARRGARDAADDVLRSLRGSTTLKGRRANVRRDRDFAGAGRGRS